jgi:hypothetical protein
MSHHITRLQDTNQNQPLGLPQKSIKSSIQNQSDRHGESFNKKKIS